MLFGKLFTNPKMWVNGDADEITMGGVYTCKDVQNVPTGDGALFVFKTENTVKQVFIPVGEEGVVYTRVLGEKWASVTGTSEETEALIQSAIDKANQAQAKADTVDTRLNNIIVESGTSEAEVVAARTDSNGQTFTTLGQRLDTQFGEIKEDLTHHISLAELDWKSGYIYTEKDLITQTSHKRKGDFDTNNSRYVTSRLYYFKKGSTISAITPGYWFSVYRYDASLNYVSRALSQTQYTTSVDGWYAIVIGTTPNTDFVANDIPVAVVLQNYTSTLTTPASKYYTERVNLTDFAKGDGISDDTITINRVLSMLGAKDVFIGEKTFIVTDRITLPSGICVHGCGESSVIKLSDTFDLVALTWRPDYDANNKYMRPILYSASTSTGIALKNFMIDGSTTYVDQQQIGICVCGKNHLIENMIVKNINYFPENFPSRVASVSGIGLFCFQAENVNIIGGSYYNTGYEDIGTEYATNITIDGTYCGESNRTCIQPHRTSKDIHITNNQLDNIITLGQATITIHGQGSHEISGVVITGNSIKGGKITFVGTFEHDIIINGNTFECIDPVSIIATRTDVENTRNYNFVVTNNVIKATNAIINLVCDYAIIANNIIKSNGAVAVITMRGGSCSANNNTFAGTNNTINITDVEPIN